MQPSWPPMLDFPPNLHSLHTGEEILHRKSAALITANELLLLHINIVERVMSLADVFRDYSTEDEDLKVIQMYGFRLFNNFSSSSKLMMSGYYQSCAMIMRDILEVVFLLDLFQSDRAAITRWRSANKKDRWDEFKPVKVREALDKRDGASGKKRAEMYNMFSELASHINMNSTYMLKPNGLDIIHMGPFLDPTLLKETLDELGRLAVQAGETLNAFFPVNWTEGAPIQKDFQVIKYLWITKFYPKALNVSAS